MGGGGVRVLRASRVEDSRSRSQPNQHCDTNPNEMPTTSMIEKAEIIPSTGLLNTLTDRSELTFYEPMQTETNTRRSESANLNPENSTGRGTDRPDDEFPVRATSGRSPGSRSSSQESGQSDSPPGTPGWSLWSGGTAPDSQINGRSLSAGVTYTYSQPSSLQQGRGRNLVRNRDVYDTAKSPRSTDSRSTSLPITKTANLSEQDERFDQLRKSPEDNKREWNRRFPSGTIVVYTDGSALGNYQSGFGIYYGPNHELNRSERIDQPPHCSSRAEVLAAIRALRNLRDWHGYKEEPVLLRTDALMIIKYLNGDRGPQWFNESKNECLAELAELKTEIDKFPNGVKFEHVHAHAGPDVDPGNEAADDLARQATVGPNRSRSASRDRSGEPDRRNSRNNNAGHIRSHSAHVIGRRRA